MSEPSPRRRPLVVDTDVVSYLHKGDTRGAQYASLLIGYEPVVSFMTLAELDAWAAQRNWGRASRLRLERFLADFAVHYPGRELCQWWAAVTTSCRKAGRPIGVADAWIAASALVLGAPLLTNNPGDYAAVPDLIAVSP